MSVWGNSSSDLAHWPLPIAAADSRPGTVLFRAATLGYYLYFCGRQAVFSTSPGMQTVSTHGKWVPAAPDGGVLAWVSIERVAEIRRSFFRSA